VGDLVAVHCDESTPPDDDGGDTGGGGGGDLSGGGGSSSSPWRPHRVPWSHAQVIAIFRDREEEAGGVGGGGGATVRARHRPPRSGSRYDGSRGSPRHGWPYQYRPKDRPGGGAAGRRC
jgi:hypothetical protein